MTSLADKYPGDVGLTMVELAPGEDRWPSPANRHLLLEEGLQVESVCPWQTRGGTVGMTILEV